MLSLAMILMRLITAAVRLAGGLSPSSQHAVDAVAHLQPVLERFDVDVRRAQFDRALDDQVDQADHRRFGGEVAQVLDVVHVAASSRRRRSRRSCPSRCGPGRASARSGRRSPNAGRPAGRTVAAGRQPHRIDRVAVLRIGHPQRPARPSSFAEQAEMELLEEAQRQRLRVGQQFRRRFRHVLAGQQRQVAALRRRFRHGRVRTPGPAAPAAPAGCRRFPPAGAGRARGRLPSAGLFRAGRRRCARRHRRPRDRVRWRWRWKPAFTFHSGSDRGTTLAAWELHRPQQGIGDHEPPDAVATKQEPRPEPGFLVYADRTSIAYWRATRVTPLYAAAPTSLM